MPNKQASKAVHISKYPCPVDALTFVYTNKWHNNEIILVLILNLDVGLNSPKSGLYLSVTGLGPKTGLFVVLLLWNFESDFIRHETT